MNKVLQDDQVFAILEGEGREPRRHSPLPGNPLQETVSLKSKLGLLNGCHLNLFPRASSKKGSESLETIWVFAADFQARTRVELAFLSAVIGPTIASLSN